MVYKVLFALVMLVILTPGISHSQWGGSNHKDNIDCSVASLTLTDAATEYSYTFPRTTGNLAVKGRTSAAFQYCWTSAGSGTTYVTVPAGSQWYLESLNLRHKRITYFQSATAGLVLEIEYCTHDKQ